MSSWSIWISVTISLYLLSWSEVEARGSDQEMFYCTAPRADLSANRRWKWSSLESDIEAVHFLRMFFHEAFRRAKQTWQWGTAQLVSLYPLSLMKSEGCYLCFVWRQPNATRQNFLLLIWKMKTQIIKRSKTQCHSMHRNAKNIEKDSKYFTLSVLPWWIMHYRCSTCSPSGGFLGILHKHLILQPNLLN